jgi:hypothetical protein
MNNVKEEIQKEMNVIELQFIRDSIENMMKINQVEALRILHKYSNVILNENNYGVHVNLSELPQSAIDDLKKHIQYVQTQENNLEYMETQKNNMRSLFKDKEVKDLLQYDNK